VRLRKWNSDFNVLWLVRNIGNNQYHALAVYKEFKEVWEKYLLDVDEKQMVNDTQEEQRATLMEERRDFEAELKWKVNGVEQIVKTHQLLTINEVGRRKGMLNERNEVLNTKLEN